MKRVIFARIPINDDELVLSVDAHERLDVRLWTATGTGGPRMASANGLTLHVGDVPKLIAALERAAREAAAA